MREKERKGKIGGQKKWFHFLSYLVQTQIGEIIVVPLIQPDNRCFVIFHHVPFEVPAIDGAGRSHAHTSKGTRKTNANG